MNYSRLWLPVVLSTALFACDCNEKDCTTPTVTSNIKVAICQSGSGRIRIDGTGFASGASVELSDGTQTFTATSVSVSSDGTHIDADMPSGLAAGVSYEVIVDNGGCTDAAPHQQITAVSGAFVFLTDPDVVYDGINTRVTVYSTSLDLPLPTDGVQITPNGQTTPSTSLAWTPVTGQANRVQVVVPSAQAVGAYDLTLTDGIGCTTTLTNAVTVTSDLTVSIASVDPPFADAAQYTSVTIKRDTAAAAPANAPFVSTPRLFLNPSNPGPTDVAIPVQSVSFIDADTLTAVVPPNQPAGTYDLIIVNPDGSVGLLADALRIQTIPPPVIANITPSSIVNATGQLVSVKGTSFDSQATATVSCRDPLGVLTTATNTIAAPSCNGLDCTVDVTIDGSAVAQGSVCVLRITNGDGSYFDYSAIGVTGPSLNLGTPAAGTNMVTARRALVAAAGNATASSRFVYAIGGDGGAANSATPFASVEAASVDAYGTLGAFRTLGDSPLGTARAFAAGVTSGRYIYVTGGSDGTNVLSTAERAMILDPVEAPHLDVGDMVLHDTVGLAAGTYVYRVSAVFDANDVDNPGGESLPSDALAVRVPTVTDKKIQVVLKVDPPRDRLGALIPGIVGYRVYRFDAAGGGTADPLFLGTIPSGQTTYVDDGAATPAGARPLAAGSLGRWRSLPVMGVPRMGHAGAIARDPGDANALYLYALLGSDTAGSVRDDYEYLAITQLPNGHQTFATAWSTGTTTSSQGRWQIGAWTADSVVSSIIPSGETYVYVGGGILGNGNAANVVEAGHVTAGGLLELFDDTPKDFTSARAGYGLCAANGQLFAFGGAGASPSAGAAAANLSSPAPSLDAASWNNEGLTMTHSRYLMGSTVQSAFIFLVGGETEAEAASATTELVIW